MKRQAGHGRTAVLCAVLALLVGCAGTPVVRSVELAPAAADISTHLRRIAVLPFQGAARAGMDPAAELELQLAAVRVDGQPHFTVVERRRLTPLLDELNLPVWGLADAQTAARTGRLLGAQAVVHGELAQHELRTQRVPGRRPVCVQYETRTDKRGHVQQGRCLRTEWRPAVCTEQTAMVRMRLRLVDVESGAILFAREFAGQVGQSACDDDGFPGVPESELLRRARAEAVQEARLALAPSYREVARPLLRAWPAGAGPTAQQLHERALAFAAGGRTDPACALWAQALLEPGGGTVATWHNLGVCAEVDGRLKDALQHHLQAERVSATPEPVVTRAIDRVQAALREAPRFTALSR